MTWRFFLYLITAWVFLSLIAGTAWALCGYMWNRVRVDPPMEDDSEEWALYAERTR